MDQAEAAHAHPRGVEEAVVLHEGAVGVPGRVGLGVGRPVRRLDPVHRAAGRHEVERAHEVADRAEPDPRPVRGGGHHAGDGLPVVAAHLEQRPALGVELGVQLPQPDAGAAAGQPRRLGVLPQQLGLERQRPGQPLRARSGSPPVSATSDQEWPEPIARTVSSFASASRTSSDSSSTDSGRQMRSGSQPWLPVWFRQALRTRILTAAPRPRARRRCAPPARRWSWPGSR